MNVLFMTIGKMDNIEEHTIYCDLLRYFRDMGPVLISSSPSSSMISVPLALLLPITRLLYNLFHLFLVIMYDLCVLLYYLFIRNPFVCLIFTN